MITATASEWGTVRVDGFCNKGEQYCEPWLIVISGGGYSSRCLVAIASDPHEAMDVYADSKYASITKMDAPPIPEEEDWYIQLGNLGDWHDLSHTTRNSVVPCKVNYFAKKNSLDS